MDSSSPKIDTLLKAHMKFMTQRQAVLAQNIANIDTPGYKAQDLKKVDFGAMVEAASQPMGMTTTNPQHMYGGGGNGAFATQADRNTFEISPTGNNVVLEDQMAKISDTGAQFQLSSNMLRKFTQLYRIAAGNKG